MRSTSRSIVLVFVIGLALGLAAPSAGMAQGPGSDAGSWTLRGFGVWIHPSDDPFPFGPPIEDPPLAGPRLTPSFTLDDGSGWGLALEYRVTRRLGIEAQAILADLDSEFRLRFGEPVNTEGADRRELETDVYGLGVNFHLTPERRIDVYAGVFGALVSYGEFQGVVSGITFFQEVDDDTALGVGLGADLFVDPSRRWAATAAVRRLWSTATPVEGLGGIDVDPVIVTAGVAVRWGS